MANLDPRVTLILDRSYGSRASEDAQRGPLWIIKSDQNAGTVRALWREYGNSPEHVEYITEFRPEGDSAEESCIYIIPVILEHHPRLLELTVIGSALTPRLRSVLGEGEYRETDEGFVFCKVTTA